MRELLEDFLGAVALFATLWLLLILTP